MAETVLYSIPGYVRDFVQEQGYPMPYSAMEGYIDSWHAWMMATGSFYDYDDRDGAGRRYKVHRRSIKPAKRVCEEWASLLLNDDTTVQCEDQACTDWLADYFDSINFYGLGQGLVTKAFALGTGAWAVWLDVTNAKMQLRRYDARMVLPLSWDDDGISECAFCTRAFDGRREIDQLQLHVKEADGYHIRTVCFDEKGERIEAEGVIDDLPTGCETPTFAVVKPAIENTCVDLSPFGQSVFEDAIDAVQAVDLAYDAIFSEVDLSKMRIFLSDMMFEVSGEGGERQAIPFGKHDCTVYRKISSTDDMIKEFAPQLRTDAQAKALRTALQTLGDLTGFGLNYFDIDDSGGLKTATEVSADNSALMRNIRRHENLMEGAIAQISRAAIHCANAFLGESLPDPGTITVNWDDSIITDTAAEKAQDMAEVGTTLNAWEYRCKWYGEDEETAKANVPGGEAPAFEEPFAEGGDEQDERAEEQPEADEE